jgi:hypothetical protein
VRLAAYSCVDDDMMMHEAGRPSLGLCPFLLLGSCISGWLDDCCELILVSYSLVFLAVAILARLPSFPYRSRRMTSRTQSVSSTNASPRRTYTTLRLPQTNKTKQTKTSKPNALHLPFDHPCTLSPTCG